MTADTGRQRRETYSLRRREVARKLVANRDGLLVVSGLGQPTWDVTAAGDHPLTFPLWGAMGGAAMVGLGLALARPEHRVLVITGDGEMLMGLGALATLARAGPRNLAVAVLDNESYGETGMQESHTAGATDLAAMARAAGIAAATTVAEEKDVAAAVTRLRRDDGPVFVDFKVRAETLPLVMPPKDGGVLKHRFRQALATAMEYVKD